MSTHWPHLTDARIVAALDPFLPPPDAPTIDVVAFYLASATLSSDRTLRTVLVASAAVLAEEDAIDPEAVMQSAKALRQRMVDTLGVEDLLASLDAPSSDPT